MTDLEIFEHIKVSKIQQKTQEEIYGELMAKGVTVDRIQKQFENAAANKPPAQVSGGNFSQVTPEGIVQLERKQDDTRDPISTTPAAEVPVHAAPLDNHTKLVRALVTFGAIFVAVGIFSFVAANWKEITSVVKVAVLVGSVLVTYISGWFIREKTSYGIIGAALIFLGTLIYGASIFLVAQIFNIRATWPDGFVLWMLGALAVGVAVDIWGVYVLAILLGFISIFGYPVFLLSAFLYGRIQGDVLISTGLLIVATLVLFSLGASLLKRLPSKEYY